MAAKELTYVEYYHGKSIKVKIEDQNGTVISSKIDIGVHKRAPKVEKVVDGLTGFLFYDENDMPLVAMHW